jgi:hypothetical protein
MHAKVFATIYLPFLQNSNVYNQGKTVQYFIPYQQLCNTAAYRRGIEAISLSITDCEHVQQTLVIIGAVNTHRQQLLIQQSFTSNR